MISLVMRPALPSSLRTLAFLLAVAPEHIALAIALIAVVPHIMGARALLVFTELRVFLLADALSLASVPVGIIAAVVLASVSIPLPTLGAAFLHFLVEDLAFLPADTRTLTLLPGGVRTTTVAAIAVDEVARGIVIGIPGLDIVIVGVGPGNGSD